MVVRISFTLMLQLIIEQILLDYSCISTIVFIVKAIRIILIKQLSHMRINGEGLYVMKSEEAYTIGYLRPYPINPDKLLHSLSIAQLWKKR